MDGWFLEKQAPPPRADDNFVGCIHSNSFLDRGRKTNAALFIFSTPAEISRSAERVGANIGSLDSLASEESGVTATVTVSLPPPPLPRPPE